MRGRIMATRTVAEQIKALDPDTLVKLVNEYGCCWIGRAKFVFGAVTYEAWNGTDIEVVVCK